MTGFTKSLFKFLSVLFIFVAVIGFIVCAAEADNAMMIIIAFAVLLSSLLSSAISWLGYLATMYYKSATDKAENNSNKLQISEDTTKNQNAKIYSKDELVEKGTIKIEKTDNGCLKIYGYGNFHIINSDGIEVKVIKDVVEYSMLGVSNFEQGVYWIKQENGACRSFIVKS